jgi:hypothetical protein
MRALTRRPVVLAMLLVVVGITRAETLGPKPILIRILGHVGAPRETDRKIAELTLRHVERTIDFTVDEIWVLSGDAAGVDVLHEVEQYTPSMSVSGPKEVLRRLTGASPDDPLELTGYYRRGQRMLMLSSVERAKPKK